MGMILDKPTAIVGVTGSGKTYVAKGMVEKLIAEGSRVCTIDPTGAWYGLRSAADGKGPGLPVVIFGGDHGDVPIHDKGGAVLGKIIGAEKVRASIIDVSEFTTGEATRFLTAFFEELYRSNKRMLYLILDEADAMAPQQPLPEQQRLKGAVNKIVRRGRIKGFIPTMITQRPAVLDKSVMSQLSNLIAMKLTAPQDRKAIETWVKGNADADQAAAVLQSLAKLPIGEGWLWAPHDSILEQRKFGPITTFDSSAPPGDDWQEPVSALIDVAELLELMTQEIDEPVEPLKAGKIFKAGKISAAPAVADQVAAAEAKGYDRGRAAGALAERLRLMDRLKVVLDGLQHEISQLGENVAVDGSSFKITEIMRPLNSNPQPAFQVRPVSQLEPPVSQQDRPASQRKRLDRQPGELPKAARRLIAVLDTNPPVRRSWRQAATLAGMKGHGGSFNTAKKALLESGLIVVSGDLISIATPSAEAVPAAIDAAQLVGIWEGSLVKAAGRILRFMFETKRPVTKQEISAGLGIAAHGGSWNSAWKELRDNEIIVITGDTATLSEMFQ